MEIPWQDPARLFARLRGLPYLAWLDGASGSDPRGRFSTLAADPWMRVVAPVGGADPWPALAEAVAGCARPGIEAPVPFAAGAIGMVGYEASRHLERLRFRHPDRVGLPEMTVGLYDASIGFDLRAKRVFVLSTGLPRRGAAGERRARARAEWLAAAATRPAVPEGVVPAPEWRAALSRAEYCRRVERVRALIAAGDIFQANFTLLHTAPRPAGVAAADLHLALRARSAAPFSAFLSLDAAGDMALASASPERFLSLSPFGEIETRPIKGTRPRDADPARDAALAAELAASVKDRAENLMIVDLLRNDLTRVAVPGSVTVPTLYEVENFPGAHHLVSEVRARLAPGRNAVDLLRACFPGGSVTGAPKLRAMEIIDEVEPARRGAYCGTVLRIGIDGAMDSSIVIRSLAIGTGTMAAQAGGAITWDSDPGEEWAEMRTKLAPLLLGGTVTEP